MNAQVFVQFVSLYVQVDTAFIRTSKQLASGVDAQVHLQGTFVFEPLFTAVARAGNSFHPGAASQPGGFSGWQGAAAGRHGRQQQRYRCQ